MKRKLYISIGKVSLPNERQPFWHGGMGGCGIVLLQNECIYLTKMSEGKMIIFGDPYIREVSDREAKLYYINPFFSCLTLFPKTKQVIRVCSSKCDRFM